MSEAGPKPMQELIAMLPEGCRGCFMALEGLETARDTEEAMIVVRGIKGTCSGWTGEEPPHESLVRAEGSLEFRKTSILAMYCPYDQTVYTEDTN